MPVLPFLANLAPVAVTGTRAGYVSAARPPRFAAIEEEAVADAAPRMPMLDADPNVPARRPARGAAAAPAEQQPDVPTPPIPSHHAPVAARQPSMHAHPQPQTSTEQVQVPQVRSHATPPGAHRTEKPSAVSRELAAQPQIVSPPATTVSRHAPLREGVRVERVMREQQSSPQIVQLTIDRIDVRAPTASKPAVTPQKSRRSASPTLSEYLRQTSSSGGSDTAR
jgi:hypothetical protein